MEFRARLGTPGGEIIEGVYVSENEAPQPERASYVVLRRARTRKRSSTSGYEGGTLRRAGSIAFNTAT